MKIISKVKKRIFNYLDLIEVPNTFFYAFSLLFVLIIILPKFVPGFTRSLVGFDLMHNKVFDLIYKVIDPLIVSLFFGLYVFSKYILLLYPQSAITKNNISSNKILILKRIVVAIILFSISTVSIKYLEDNYFKPIFNYSRPITRIEHSIINDIYENGYTNINIDAQTFKCKTAQIILGLEKTYSGVRNITVDDIISEAKKQDIKIDKNDLEYIFYKRGNYPNDLSLKEKVKLLGKIDKTKARSLTLWLSDKIDKTSNECEYDESCPSGFVMRQIFIWFFAYLLFVQTVKVKEKIFTLDKKGILFIISNTIGLLFIAFSRIYGYRHTLYDEYISLLLTTILTVVLLFLYYLRKKVRLEDTIVEINELHVVRDKYFNQVMDCFYQTDDKDIIINCNKAFEDTFGFGEESATKSDIRELYVNKGDRGNLKKELNKLQKNGDSDIPLSDYLIYVHKWKKENERFVISVDCNYFKDIKRGIKMGIEGTVRKASRIIEDMVDGFYRANDEEKITYCNESFMKMFGYGDRHDIMFTDIRNLYSNKNDRDKFLTILSEKQIVKNFIVPCKKIKEYNGAEPIYEEQPIIVEVNSHYIDNNDHSKGVEGTVREITLLKIFYDYSFHGIYIIQKENETLKFSYVNDKLKNMFGYSDSEMTIQEFVEKITVENVVASKDYPRVEKQLFLKLENKKEDEIEERYTFLGKRKDGTPIPVEVNSTYYPNYKGQSAVVGYIRDITLEEKEKKQIKSHFSQGILNYILHEINNPLSGVCSFMQTLLEDAKDNKELTQEQRKIIYKECYDGLKECTDLSVYLRNVLSCIDIPPVVVRLNDILYRFKARETGNINIIINMQDDIFVFAHPVGLAIIFNNLYKNSVESMPEGGTIEIKVNMENEKCIIKFSDTGAGIDKSIIKNIFEPGVSNKTGRGRGLGLTLSKDIVTGWGGDIDVYESTENNTIFKITLINKKEK